MRKLLFLIAVFPLFAQREIVLQTGDGKMVSIEAPATAATDLRWILPTIDGSANDCLVTDGSGNWNFAACSTVALPFLVSTDFDWQQSPTSPATLTSGNPETVTLAPCPLGINGTTVGFPFVLKGTGGTETTLSTGGGDCSPGATSGTVTFIAPASYDAGYTIGSIDNGVTEAIYHAYFNAAGQPGGYGNADILIPAGRYTVYGTTKYYISGSGQSITIRGAGTGVTLVARDTSFTSGNQFQLGTPGGVAGAKYILRDLTSQSPQSLQVTSGAHVGIYPNNVNAELRNLDLYNGYDGVGVYSSSANIRNVYYTQEWQHACPTGADPCTGGHSARYGLDLTKDGAGGGPVSGVHVSDSGFTSSYPWHSTYSLRAGVHITGSSGIEIFDSRLSGWAGAHLITDAVNAIQDVWFDNVMIDDMGQEGIYMEGANPSGTFNSNIMISGSHIRAQGGGAATVQNGITNLMSGSNFRISDTEISGFLNGYCMQFQGGAVATVNGLQLIGNDLTNCDVGMQVPGANYTNVIINGNRVGKNLMYPITMSVGLDLPSGSTSMAIGLNDFSLATVPIYYTAGGQTFTDLVIGQNIGVDTVVPVIASAASIAAPLNPVIEITGVTPIDTITHGSIGRKVSLIFTDNAPTGLTAAGNIAVAVTAVKDIRVDCTYAGTKWYCATAGGNSEVTAQYIPYAAANGLLQDTSIWWDSANKLAYLRHETLSGGQYVQGYGTGIYGVEMLMGARGTPTVPVALASGDYLGYLGFAGFGTSTWGATGTASIMARATEAFTNTAKGTELLFWTTPNATVTPVTRMKIAQNGYVGIGDFGTADPEASIHIMRSGDTYPEFYIDRYATTGGDTGVLVRTARGTFASPTAVQADERFAFFVGAAYYTGGSAGFGNTAGISMWAAENQTNIARGSYIKFETTTIGATSRTEKMRLSDAGVLSVTDFRLGTSTTAGWVLTADSSGNGEWAATAGPANMVTTDTTQTIAAIKSFSDLYMRLTNTSYPAKIGRFAVRDANSDGIAVYTLPLNTASLAGLETAQTFTAAQTISTNAAQPLTVEMNTAGINDIVLGQYLKRNTTGTAGIGMGVRFNFVLEDAGTSDIATNAIVSRWTNPAAANREAMMEFWSAKANSQALAMSIDTNGVVTTTTNLIVGGTVTASGHVLPASGSSYTFGTSGATWLGAYVDNLFVYTGITAPNSAAGLSASVNCSTPGQAVKTMTVSGGLVTAVGCAAP